MPHFALEIPQQVILSVSQQEFVAIVAANRDLRLEQTATGEVLMAPPTGGESGRRNIKVGRYLDEWKSCNSRSNFPVSRYYPVLS